ncbi:MAG: SpoIIE family protein phosphatase [Bacteroidota bacterium]|nr:SpoIIE family protein phosphatase [Bacteroidota bacterium]
MTKRTPIIKVDWQMELNAAAFKYHLLIARVGLLLNLIFAIGDYFNSPVHFVDFLVFRIVVSSLTLIVVLFKNKLVNCPEVIVLVPLIGISIQNAYMYSVLEGAEFQKHTFAYITLFIAAGMFILWKPIYSIIVVGASLVANVILFWMNSQMVLSEILINGGLLTLSVGLFSILLIYSRTNLTKKEIISRLALAESNDQLALKNDIIEEKNKDIKDSINYALNIQKAILPPFEKIDSIIKDYFILYKPKDIVSGDFYWFDTKLTTPRNNEPAQEVAVLAAVDCTGHGVPGALMSVIGSTILNQTINRATVNNPGDALSQFNKKVSETLSSIKDGMDMALCSINFEKLELQYAGANNPLYIVRKITADQLVDGKVEGAVELIEIKADKQAIGADTAKTKIFTNHKIKLEKGDAIYLFTDGYADQFGGEKGKKFKYSKFKELLIENHGKTMKEQKNILENHFEKWKGDLEQVDDILVIGIKV